LLLIAALATPAWAQSAPSRPPAVKKPPVSDRRQSPAPPRPTVDARAVLQAMEEAFSAAADRVTPAVVNVSTTPRRSTPGSADDPQRFREFFGEEFYERYLRRRPREEPRAGGSGVIVDPAGYILTNNHVIENAQHITVRLSDSRKFTATLVGRDPKTDLAVLKVDAPAPLPAAEMGDSERLRVGQWVIAIGNPFGLDRTVTAGIVSATARTRVGVTTYENFIQTDASINPGNSGGPLLDAQGRVIGINSQIATGGGQGSVGIGFAVPVNTAKQLLPSLRRGEDIERAYLGVRMLDVSEAVADEVDLPVDEGVLVESVEDGSPAQDAGVRGTESDPAGGIASPGDVIVSVDGEEVTSADQVVSAVAGKQPGDSISLEVRRGDDTRTLRVELGERPDELGGQPTPEGEPGEPPFSLP
ncbi:MAG: S1C family serine protease, partial [Thermoleophilaceae bacterium]